MKKYWGLGLLLLVVGSSFATQNIDIPSGGGVWGTITGTLSNQTDLQNALNAKVSSTVTISTTSPLSGGGDLSANRTLTIANSAADGTTKGAASFTAADFDATSGNISIDYTNAQAASGSLKGFLTSADWTTFNGKLAPSNNLSDVANVGTASNNLTPAAQAISALAVDWSTGFVFYKSVSANSTFTFSNIKDGKSIQVIVIDSGTHVMTFPTTTWQTPDGTQPSQRVAGATVYTFIRANGVTYGIGS